MGLDCYIESSKLEVDELNNSEIHYPDTTCTEIWYGRKSWNLHNLIFGLFGQDETEDNCNYIQIDREIFLEDFLPKYTLGLIEEGDTDKFEGDTERAIQAIYQFFKLDNGENLYYMASY